jgi:hypothetical protein
VGRTDVMIVIATTHVPRSGRGGARHGYRPRRTVPDHLSTKSFLMRGSPLLKGGAAASDGPVSQARGAGQLGCGGGRGGRGGTFGLSFSVLRSLA